MNRRIFALLLASAFLAGCSTGNVTVEDRLACLELSSYSFTSVPNCASQEKCFEEVEKAFPFNEKVFSSATRSELFDAKNHLARAWLFISNARSNLKIINNQCYSEKDLSLVPKNVNELNSNLLTVGKEIDLFNKSAVKAINSELYDLERQDLNLVREEFLFDDFIILNQNVIDFSQKNFYSQTYASRFLLQAERFNSIAERLSLQETVQEKTLLDLVSENDSAIFNEAKKRDFPVAFIAPVFSSLSDFLLKFFALHGSVQSLKELPSFEILEATEKLSGKNDSAASAFLEMFVQNSAHRLGLGERNSAMKEEIRANTNKALERLESMANAYGSALSPELFTLSQEGASGVTSSTLDFSSLENFSANYKQKAAALTSRLYTVEEAEVLGTLTLGAKTSSLKSALKDSNNLLDELDFFGEILSGLGDKCSEKAAYIKQQLAGGEFSSSDPAIISMRSRLNSAINSFADSGQKNLETCSSIISGFGTISRLLDSSSPQESVSAEAEQCIAGIESEGAFLSDASFAEQLSSLKRIPKPFENPELVLSSCAGLRESFEKKIFSGEIFSALNSSFSKLSGNASLIEGLSSSFPGLKSGAKAKNFLERFSILSGKFSNGSAKISSFASQGDVSSAAKEADSLLAESVELLESLSSEAFESYARTEFFPSGDDNANALARVFLENPGPEINASFISVLKLDSSRAEQVFSTGNISFYPKGKDTRFVFSALLSGLNSIILDLNAAGKAEGNGGNGANSGGESGSNGNSSGAGENASGPQNNGASAELNAAKAAAASAEKQSIANGKAAALEALSKSGVVLPEREKAALDLRAQKIDFLADNNLFAQASQELALLKSDAENFAAAKDDAVENSAEKDAQLKEKVSRIDSLKKSVAEKADALEKVFSGLGGEELEEVYAFSPITLERVKGLSALASEGSASFAAADSNSVSLASLAAEEKILSDAVRELDSAAEKLKQNALSSYNVAVSKRGPSNASAEADALLVQSRQALESKDYLKSILSSSRASGLLVAAPQQYFEVPLPVYPLVLVVFLVAFYVHRKSGEEKLPKELKKIKKAEL